MFELERKFVKTVKAGLEELGLIEALPADKAVSALEAIIASAKTVKARAVMIAAERCIPPAKQGCLASAFELRTLSRLAAQFEDGLLEIDTSAAAKAPAKSSASDLSVVNDRIETPSETAAQTEENLAMRAADTLENVLPFAQAGNAEALRDLLRLGRSEPGPVLKTPDTEKPVSLESLIAPVTSQALVSAHRAHKQVSLSYACEHVAVQNRVAPALQALLLTLCDGLIDLSLRHPASREASKMPGTGQIALTATQTGRGLTLDLFCDDTAIAADDLFTGPCARAASDYRALGGDIEFKPGRAAGVMIVITYTEAHKAMPAAPILREAIA